MAKSICIYNKLLGLAVSFPLPKVLLRIGSDFLTKRSFQLFPLRNPTMQTLQGNMLYQAWFYFLLHDYVTFVTTHSLVLIVQLIFPARQLFHCIPVHATNTLFCYTVDKKTFLEQILLRRRAVLYEIPFLQLCECCDKESNYWWVSLGVTYKSVIILLFFNTTFTSRKLIEL